MGSWNDLSIREKSEMMKVAIKNGITDLNDIRQAYNEFAEGGGISDKQYYATMEKVAKDNWRKWGDESEDVALTKALNSNTYDYRGYYNKYPDSAANADTHWDDEFKLPAHESFSNLSKYSGKVSDYNPRGLVGGHWSTEDDRTAKFIPMGWQAFNNRFACGGNKYVKGGNLFEEGGGILDWFKNLFSSKQEDKKPLTYREKPAAVTKVIYPNNKKEYKVVPKRIRENTSKTKNESEKYENQMKIYMVEHQKKNKGSNPIYDIPFIPEKKILIGRTTTSTNALDTLAKYAAIHNANPQLSQHPILHSSKYKKPRPINNNEMLGLSFQETSNGAWPYKNTGRGGNDTAIANSNYFTAFGYIPADIL